MAYSVNLRALSILFLFGMITGVNAQNPGDTITVQTIDYNSTTRDTMITFPDFSGLTFEKVLMRYNMRCRDGAINTTGGNNVACGEWDYSCNTYLTDSTRTDSVSAIHPDFIVSGFDGTVYPYRSDPTYTYYQSIQTEVIYNNVISEETITVGSGDISDETPFNNEVGDAKTIYLYTADDLINAGLSNGTITGLRMEISELGSQVTNLRISLKETDATELDPSDPHLGGYTQVYYLNTTFDAVGEYQFNFSEDFEWDGSSGILVQLTYDNTEGTGSEVLSQAAEQRGLSSSAEDYFLEFNGESYLAIENSYPSVSSEITISFWSYGNEDLLPANTTIFEGKDLVDSRQLNVHLPWGNSRVYWDCGNDGSGYDRIDKAANLDEFAGQWSHWAFTKNTSTGSMKIYLNGNLWHSGNGKTKPIDLQALRLGRSILGSRTYYGKMDEFQVWDIELSAQLIQDYMHTSIDEEHPYYENLVTYYKFNEGNGDLASDETNLHNATLEASPVWRQKEGRNIMMDFELLSELPNLTLVQGEYETTAVETPVLDSLINPSNTVISFGIEGTDLIELGQEIYYLAGSLPIFDEGGDEVGSINVEPENTIEIGELFYYQKFPMKYEIMSFVTPYGIGLDMTPTGRTWTFDLTDFTPILNGSKRMTLERGGQWQEEMDIQFQFIVGTPPRDVIDIQQIWKVDQRNYAVINDDTYFPPRDVPTLVNGSGFKVRSAITGHGQEGEFIPRTHHVDINGGTNEFSWQVWKECSANPLFPQGGTWIYDRAGWCPGMATDVQEFDISDMVTPGETINIDYGMNTATGDSRYIVNHQLVTYSEPNHQLDAAVVQIRKPSDEFEFDRFGTICHTPEVVIRNTGSETLTSAIITYWVNDATTPETFNWSGSLEFLESETVLLPTPQTLWQSLSPESNEFYVSISSPNGGSDEYSFNDTFKTGFVIPEVVPNHFIIIVTTNNQPQENDYVVKDDNGNVIFERDFTAANTLHRDTLMLDVGCYTFTFNDSDDDGINFWANNDGNGVVRMKEVSGPTFKYFETDYGDGIHYEFTIDYPLTYEELRVEPSLKIFPNPTTDDFQLSFSGFDDVVNVRILNAVGQVLFNERLVNPSPDFVQEFSLAGFESGVYVVQVTDGSRVSSEKVMKE